MNFTIPAALAIILLGLFLFMFMPKGRLRLGALAFFAVYTALLAAGSLELLGTAKPFNLEWRELQSNEILGFYVSPDEDVFLWVLRDGAPVAYYIPDMSGDKKKIENLQDAGRLALGRGALGLSNAESEAAIVPADEYTLPPKVTPDAPSVTTVH